MFVIDLREPQEPSVRTKPCNVLTECHCMLLNVKVSVIAQRL